MKCPKCGSKALKAVRRELKTSHNKIAVCLCKKCEHTWAEYTKANTGEVRVFSLPDGSYGRHADNMLS